MGHRLSVADWSGIGIFILTGVLVWEGFRQPPAALYLLLIVVLMLALALAAWFFFQVRRVHGPRIKNIEKVSVYLGHRILPDVREKYYEAAFTSGKDVLYPTIMSQDTLKEMSPRLERSVASGTKLRVLTWAGDIDKTVIEAFRLHLGENANDPARTVSQVQQAVRDWRDLERRFSNVEVREFRSIATMQGIVVGDSWALVELIPFHTFKNDRPALLLEAENDPELFNLFKSKWEDLWQKSKPSTARAVDGVGSKTRVGRET